MSKCKVCGCEPCDASCALIPGRRRIAELEAKCAELLAVRVIELEAQLCGCGDQHYCEAEYAELKEQSAADVSLAKDRIAELEALLREVKANPVWKNRLAQRIDAALGAESPS